MRTILAFLALLSLSFASCYFDTSLERMRCQASLNTSTAIQTTPHSISANLTDVRYILNRSFSNLAKYGNTGLMLGGNGSEQDAMRIRDWYGNQTNVSLATTNTSNASTLTPLAVAPKLPAFAVKYENLTCYWELRKKFGRYLDPEWLCNAGQAMPEYSGFAVPACVCARQAGLPY